MKQERIQRQPRRDEVEDEFDPETGTGGGIDTRTPGGRPLPY